MIDPSISSSDRIDRGSRRAADGRGGAERGAAGIVVLPGALLAALGWLYVLRGLGWFAIGPRVCDALPLLQLAGFDVQPLGRVVVAWLAAGMVAGVALAWMPRLWRGVLAGLVAIVALSMASQASFALTRNLRFGDVIWSRRPGAGPLLEAVLFALGAVLPGRLPRGWAARVGRRAATGVTRAAPRRCP